MSGKGGVAKDSNELTLTSEDKQRWNDYQISMAEEAEKLKQVQIELTMLDAGKIKHEIATLIKNQATFLPKENVTRMEEDVKKIRTEIANNSYEMQATKDMVAKTDKTLDLSIKDIKTSLQNSRKTAEKQE